MKNTEYNTKMNTEIGNFKIIKTKILIRIMKL